MVGIIVKESLFKTLQFPDVSSFYISDAPFCQLKQTAGDEQNP